MPTGQRARESPRTSKRKTKAKKIKIFISRTTNRLEYVEKTVHERELAKNKLGKKAGTRILAFIQAAFIEAY